MSIFKVNPSDFQTITVATNPSKYYSSSSSGTTGSIFVFARRSSIEKDILDIDDPETPFNESTLFKSLEGIKNSPGAINFGNLQNYLTGVNQSPISFKKQTEIGVVRFTPPSYFTTGTLKKLAVKDNLSSYYRSTYPSAHWGYCNYHSLNFFSSSTVQTSSVLLYPNVNSGYVLTGAFSLDFHINPRYNTLDSSGHFKAGTIFHLSSSYVLSLITGSAKNLDGKPSGFRLQLQLERSSNFSPSTVSNASVSPKDLIFLSEDNSLKWNNWHHVVVRWGTNSVNHGTGSFVIDGIQKGTFIVPSSSLSTPASSAALCIGNYYEGNNLGNNSTIRFFGNIPAYAEGVYRFTSSNVNYPDVFQFNHPLQAEVHDLSIKKFYVTDNDILSSGSTGITDLRNVAFYVPPFFTLDSDIRGSITPDASKTTGVVYTPAIASTGMTTTPFSVPMAFGVGGHYINTENFLKDFASNYRPRQLFLSATLVSVNSNSSKTANEILYSQPAVRKRNLMILPCDDGSFYPDYGVLSASSFQVNYFTQLYSSKLSKDPKSIVYVDDLGNPMEGFISLNNMVYTGSRFDDPYTESIENDPLDKFKFSEDTYIDDQIVFSPQYPTRSPPSDKKMYKNLEDIRGAWGQANLVYDRQQQSLFAIPFKTQDASSNQVVFFDISNLFYGTRILPGSFSITDSNLSGSGGAISITIKDDGNGTLYRADSLTSHCTWNSVGTIFYNEGIVVIKNPHLYFFGENQYEMSFKGEQNIHVLRLDTLAPTNYLNSSSNPTYKNVPSTNRPNEPDPNFVYITGINFHDDNLNVIMKSQLAQPIMKRFSDKILFKVKYDF